jgi:hypothetical protein
MTHALPIKSLGRCLRIRKTIEYRRVQSFCVGKAFTHERDARQTEFQLRPKFFSWQITVNPKAFISIRIEYDHSGRPVRVETMEVGGTLFDVCFERYEVFVDEVSGCFVVV